MLLLDLRSIGSKLLERRKNAGLTQNELAELAGLSERTYADIERGTVNMRLASFLRICVALNITPNDILTVESGVQLQKEELINQLDNYPQHAQQTALSLLQIYLDSL